jgi:hypothetical protein
MAGLLQNEVIEKLDLSDNDLGDTEAMHIIQYMKNQAQIRDNALWMTDLRHTNKDKRPS